MSAKDYTVVGVVPENGGDIEFAVSPREPVHRGRVAVSVNPAGGIQFDWHDLPAELRREQDEIQADIAGRIAERGACLAQFEQLADSIEAWSKELGWSTRRVMRKLDDDRIGPYRAPGVLMQFDFSRVLLEPLGRDVAGNGLADIYLMPAYDDVARLQYGDGHWNVNRPVGADSAPLTKDGFERLMGELVDHAAQA